MKISVVITTYNSEKTIEKCLLSIYQQTHPPYEIIVVDGKSTDSTTEIIRRFDDFEGISQKKSTMATKT